MERLGRSARRTAGAALVLLAGVPLHRLLLAGETGLAGRATVQAVEAQAALLWSSFLLVLAVGLILGTVSPRGYLEAGVRRAGGVLREWPVLSVALFAGAAGTVLTALFSWQVLGLRPNLIDGLSQLLHARYLAAGMWAADPASWGPHWHVHNSMLTDSGWISHYPPGHPILLAVGILVGAPWLVGPLLLGATAFFSVLLGDRLFPDDRAVGRFGGILVAVSPFLLAHAGAFMNHATAAAFGTAALYCGLRAREDARLAWALAAGAAVAAVLATRPLAGAVFATVIGGGMWLSAPAPGAGSRRRARGRLFWARSGIAALGAAPVVAGLLAWNARFTGSALRFPYLGSFGGSAGLGFGRDPWGNMYGPLEALAYTSADLTALNLSLLETPVPIVILVGGFLILRTRLSFGERVLVLWAGLPVLANALYWHHGHFMGPRMLAEFAPGWILTATAAAAWLIRSVPERVPGRHRFSPRDAARGIVLAGFVGMALLAPQRLASFGTAGAPSLADPPGEVDEGSLVFIHGSWDARIFSRLAAEGVRLDVVDAALRQNPTCLAHLHTLALERHGPPFGTARDLQPGRPIPALDLHIRAHEHQPQVRFGNGPPVRVEEGQPLAAECAREVRADRFGILDASALFWLGDLPGIEAGRPMYLRDLGPERNREILERYPDRPAFLYGRFGTEGEATLLPYQEGIELLWRSD